MKSKRPLLIGAASSILAAVLVTGINYLIMPFFADPILASFIAAAIGFTVVLFSIRFQVFNILDLIGIRYLEKQTGIMKVYPSLQDAFDDLREAFTSARRISLLLHIGRREFGVKDALFLDIMRKRAEKEDDLEIRILHIDPNSFYLSEDRARILGKRRSKWIRDVQYIHDQILEASGGKENIRVLGHREPFVWRLFIFDNEAFVSAYLHDTKNDEKAPVFRIQEGENSLYSAFCNYYNHLWLQYSDRAQSVPNQGMHSDRLKPSASADR